MPYIHNTKLRMLLPGISENDNSHVESVSLTESVFFSIFTKTIEKLS